MQKNTNYAYGVNSGPLVRIPTMGGAPTDALPNFGIQVLELTERTTDPRYEN